MSRRGRYNSSITRVRPFFQALLKRDRTGRTWLPRLLATCPDSSRIPEAIRDDPGCIDETLTLPRRYLDKIVGKEIQLERMFEYQVPPPTAFLRYLVETPSTLTWPLEKGARMVHKSDETQLRRTILVDGPEAARDEQRRIGIAELERLGAKRSRKRWWAFEGFTEVDCFLETSALVLFIEGKRTEPLAESTVWFRGRNQLVRNCEAIGDIALGRACGVIVIGETAVDAPTEAAFDAGLPHLAYDRRQAVRHHFLGQTTWRALCDAVDVPFESLPNEWDP